MNAQHQYHAHRPRKRFGQHFLTDQLILQQIVNAMQLRSQDHMVEIGPGKGALTERLWPVVARLDLIEIDYDLVAYLQKQFTAEHIYIHQADILNFDLQTIVTESKQGLRIVGNLPYNISTPLLFSLFKQIRYIQDMHFMLQKEVVTRLTATVGQKHYGRLSIMAQYHCDCFFLLHVPASAFYPRPKVESAVLRLVPRSESALPALQQYEVFVQVVREAFTFRRKTLRNALRKFISAQALEALNIQPRCRPQNLTVADYIRISNHITVE